MKTILALGGIAILVCGLAAAQTSTGNRVVIPSQSSSHPRQVNVHSLNAGIVVKAYDGKDVVVEGGDSSGSSRREESHGMRRLDVPRGVTVEASDNVIEIHSSPIGGEHTITVMVPPDTSLNLHTLNGSLLIEGVRGEIVAHTNNGRIEASRVSGTFVADTLNGKILVNMDRVDQSKPLSFSTLNGTIDVTMPADLKANARFKTSRGAVYTDFDVTLGGSLTEPDSSGQGKYRLRMDKGLEGRINGGGVEINFRTLNAPIYLRKK